MKRIARVFMVLSEELNLLAAAAKATSDAETAALASQFLAQRDQRRAAAGLSTQLVEYNASVNGWKGWRNTPNWSFFAGPQR